MPVMRCPECRSKLEFHSDRYGAQVECPACGSPLVLADELVIDTTTERRAPAATLKRSRFEVSKPTFLSGAALIISFIALMFAAWERPRGLEKYDFSTPDAAIRSEVAMKEAGDLEAIGQYEFLKQIQDELPLGTPDEAHQTLQVHRVTDLRQRKVVWLTVENNGIKKYLFRFYSKSPYGDWWINTGIPTDAVFPQDFMDAVTEWASRSGKIVEAEAE